MNTWLTSHYRYQSKPILIENRRWDPVTSTMSSLLGTSTDMAAATTGIFLKPAEEYRRGRSRSATPGPSKNSPAASRQASIETTRSSEKSSIQTLTPDHQTKPPQRTPSLAPSTASEQPRTKQKNVAGSMALASGKSLGKFFSTYTKGVLVDMPLATTEGFRALPGLWGSETKSYGQVTDWKSGATVAGKTFILGMRDGVRDLAQQPVAGAREEGAWGAVKGVAKGSGSLLSHTVSAGLGVVAYPGQGICKSLWKVGHGETKRRVGEARRAEGSWVVQMAGVGRRREVVRGYYEMNIAS